MVDIEFLRKNCPYCDKWSISTFLRSIASGVWDYSDEVDEKEKEETKKRVYADLVPMLAYFRVMDIDFGDHDINRDIGLVLQHIERREKIRCLNNNKIQEEKE